MESNFELTCRKPTMELATQLGENSCARPQRCSTKSAGGRKVSVLPDICKTQM